MLKGVIAGSYGRCMFKFMRHCSPRRLWRFISPAGVGSSFSFLLNVWRTSVWHTFRKCHSVGDDSHVSLWFNSHSFEMWWWTSFIYLPFLPSYVILHGVIIPTSLPFLIVGYECFTVDWFFCTISLLECVRYFDNAWWIFPVIHLHTSFKGLGN